MWALIAAATSASAPGRIYNVGTGRAVTINALWEAVAGLSGTTAKAVHGPPRDGDVPQSVSAIEAAATDLGFAPRVGLEAGLTTTIAWYAEKKRAQS